MSFERVTIGDCVLYRGDCAEVLPTLGIIDAVVTDPPYGSGTNTNYQRFTGMGEGRSEYAHLRINHAPIVGDKRDFDPSPWLAFAECILWGANHYSNRLPKGAWLVWDKRADNGHALLADAEAAWFSRGVGVYIFDHCWQGFARASESGKFYHPSQKPIALMEWCVRKTKGTVLDPYMGSGTTGVACVQSNRYFVGIEREQEYFDIAYQRIEEAYGKGSFFDDTKPTTPELFAESS